MKTILFPVNELRIGGAEQQLLELVRGLDKSRFHPIVAPIYRGGPLDREFAEQPGVEVVHLDRGGKLDPSTLWRMAALLRRRRVDIVQPFLSPATFFGLLPALLVGTPIKIVTERCGVRRRRGLGYRTYRTIEDRLSHFADAVVANSGAGREILVERGIANEKIRVVYNGVNRQRLSVDPERAAAHRARLGVPAGGHAIGILASLTPAKGHDTFLRAAAVVLERRPDTRFAIIGGGPLRAELEAMAAELGLGDRVVFFGNQRGVADLLGALDVLVSSSRDNEGASNSILEAMTVGVPVVATDVGGTRELVRDRVTGYLASIGNHVAIAGAIEEAIAAPADRAAIVARALEMIETRFSLERMVREYETLYADLLARRTAVAPVGMGAA